MAEPKLIKQATKFFYDSVLFTENFMKVNQIHLIYVYIHK